MGAVFGGGIGAGIGEVFHRRQLKPAWKRHDAGLRARVAQAEHFGALARDDDPGRFDAGVRETRQRVVGQRFGGNDEQPLATATDQNAGPAPEVGNGSLDRLNGSAGAGIGMTLSA